MRPKDPTVVHQHDPKFPRMLPPKWHQPRYDGGLYHYDYRVCTYCGSIHPEDVVSLIRAGGVRLEGTSKSYKRYFHIPNPIAGRRARAGFKTGPIYYVGEPPRGKIARLLATIDRERSFVPEGHRIGVLQRLEDRWSQQTHSPAPRMIQQKFYMEHVTREEWEEIVEAYREAELR